MTTNAQAFWGVPGMSPTVAGVDVAIVEAALNVVAAGFLVVTSAPLLIATRRAWRFL